MMENQSEDFVICCVFVIVMLLIFIAVYCANVLLPFLNMRSLIKSEMRRSEGREYDYWKRELKRLYITHIPIIGWIIRRINNRN